jgi:hypothetical protein
MKSRYAAALAVAISTYVYLVMKLIFVGWAMWCYRAAQSRGSRALFSIFATLSAVSFGFSSSAALYPNLSYILHSPVFIALNWLLALLVVPAIFIGAR